MCGMSILVLIELEIFADALRIVDDGPIITPSDQPDDLSTITPLCFLGNIFYLTLCLFEKGDLRRDFMYDSTLVDKFWMKSYLPTLQGCNKWRVLQTKLVPGQLVLLGNAETISIGEDAGLVEYIACTSNSILKY